MILKKHTPGPWNAVRADLHGIEPDPMRCAIAAIHDGKEYIIATIENGVPGDFCETEEINAHLIAAAPDLLEACHKLVYQFQNWVQETEQTEVWPGVSIAVEKAKQAIAKAEGVS